jgi:uncharacterized protein
MRELPDKCIAFAYANAIHEGGRYGIRWLRLGLGQPREVPKHGVSLDQIEELFRGAVLVGPDPRHSIAEERFRTVGLTPSGRAIFVAFTWRISGARRLIRPVSARYMHQKEVLSHEKEISRS